MNNLIYSISAMGSLLVHALLIILLGMGVVTSQKIQLQSKHQSTEQMPIIAKAIDYKLVEAEVKRLDKQDKQIKLNKQKAEQLAKQRIEQQKLAIQQAKLEAQQEQAKLQKMQNEVQQSKKLAEQSKRLAEQERLKLEQTILKQKAQAESLAQKQKAAEALKDENQRMERAERLASQFLSQVVELIESNRQYLLHLPNDLSTDVTFLLLPDGNVRNLRVTKSSGNISYDQAALMAVQKVTPLPMPQDATTIKKLNREITMGIKNEYS